VADRKRATSDADPPLFHHHSNTSNTNVNYELLEKLKEKDDKVSLLEYELRRAREDITNLRTQLTNIVKKPPLPTHSSSSSLTMTPEREGDELMLQRFQRERIREHEAKILNYLIKNYLVQHKYSLTAITFSEEV
jgi:predicted nuclease with TOPRIM domain